MINRLCVFEQAPDALHPLVSVRPTWGLRVGTMTLRDRIVRRLDAAEVDQLARPELGERLAEEGTPLATSVPISGTLFVDGGLLITGELVARLTRVHRSTLFMAGDRLVAAWGEAEAAVGPHDDVSMALLREGAGWERETVDAPVIARASDLIGHLDYLIRGELALIRGKQFSPWPGVSMVGEQPVILGNDVVVDPGSTLDTREGPIFLDDGVTLTGNTWLRGPAVIGAGTTLLGGPIGPLVGIGPRCKIRGEVAETIFVGYSNKAHDGFIGHSVLGEWVNLGAMTTGSDLKNNYGEVRLEMPSGTESTGLTKLGAFIGDHVKTAIGTLLATGTIIGPGANVFGSAGIGPKSIPSFAWGSHAEAGSMELDRAIALARTVMDRRGMELTPAYEVLLRRAHGSR